mmetsp:Transcript_121709/g.259785  ORF Transcript_121709/g.259785 Transcript_121709/m.259785 type:complete len:277 (-) Transcript_121709:1144-1974(-)
MSASRRRGYLMQGALDVAIQREHAEEFLVILRQLRPLRTAGVRRCRLRLLLLGILWSGAQLRLEQLFQHRDGTALAATALGLSLGPRHAPERRGGPVTTHTGLVAVVQQHIGEVTLCTVELLKEAAWRQGRCIKRAIWRRTLWAHLVLKRCSCQSVFLLDVAPFRQDIRRGHGHQGLILTHTCIPLFVFNADHVPRGFRTIEGCHGQSLTDSALFRRLVDDFHQGLASDRCHCQGPADTTLAAWTLRGTLRLCHRRVLSRLLWRCRLQGEPRALFC